MAEYHFDAKEADNYLSNGGLGEVIGLSMEYMKMGFPKVQLDSDMALAFCMLASEGLAVRSSKVEGGVQ